MAKTRSMTRNQNHDASSSRKKFKGSHDWSDLHHDVLFLIMMQLGVIDFLSFSGVCQLWRKLALAYKHRFMLSRQPMSIYTSFTANENACYLHDFMGRGFKTILPTSSVRMCVGLTSGYLILFAKKNRDFLLVNPITRHELRFPVYPYYVGAQPSRIRAILVYSPSLSGWVLLVSIRFSTTVSFSLVGERSSWEYLPCRVPICDIHVFKGKIYILDIRSGLYELRLDKMTLTPLKIKNNPDSYLLLPEFVSSAENIYLMGPTTRNMYEAQELDFENLKWGVPKKTLGEYALFLGRMKSAAAAIKPSSWDESQKHFEKSAYLYGDYVKSLTASSFKGYMWYFPHDCFNVNLLKE